MLWLARDREPTSEYGTGLCLFRGGNPPEWIDGISQSREDGTCEYLGEIGELDAKHVTVPICTAIEVVLVKPIVRPKVDPCIVDPNYRHD